MNPSISELRKRLQNPHLGRFYSDWTEYLQRVFSIYITSVLSHTPLRANHVTLLNGLLIVPMVWLMAQYNGAALGWAAFLVFLHMTVDCVDGELARLKGDGSLTGLFLDRFNTGIVYPACFAAMAIGVWRADDRDLPLFLGFIAGLANLVLRVTYGNIILSAVDGLTSRKAKAAAGVKVEAAAYAEGQSGKEGVGGDLRKRIRGKSRLMGIVLDGVDTILTRSMGLVLMVAVAAVGAALDLRWVSPWGSLTVVEGILAGYLLLSLAATTQLTIKVVRTRYPERVLASLVEP
jgi:hypothetical protein